MRQYTFNDGTANDSIGTANGTLHGNASINLGVLDLPGGNGGGTLTNGDYVSILGPLLNIPSLTDATFEAWFTFEGGGSWQRVFDFGRTVSGSGQDYIFYSPNSGNGDNRAAIRDANLAENIAIAGPMVSQNIRHHAAVVVDNASNGGSGRMSLYLDGAFGGDVAARLTQ